MAGSKRPSSYLVEITDDQIPAPCEPLHPQFYLSSKTACSPKAHPPNAAAVTLITTFLTVNLDLVQFWHRLQNVSQVQSQLLCGFCWKNPCQEAKGQATICLNLVAQSCHSVQQPKLKRLPVTVKERKGEPWSRALVFNKQKCQGQNVTRCVSFSAW